MWRSRLIFVLLLACAPDLWAQTSQARVWEEDLVIPTWKIGPPEANPTFRWSSRRQEVYPYPYKELLTDQQIDQTYRACWLENEFIKVLVLPEIGGRLHGALDKTNGYRFFYWQPTIKPALVGMTGAWISGGIEWNFPHGHRPTGFSRVQYRLVENPDGSRTVWVGEPELVHRMRWIVGLTIYPGRSVIEAKVRLYNPTPLRHSFMMWTTTAVHANDDYQAVFPTRGMTGHGKHEFFNWPIHEGVDISWWKNVPNAASFFALEPGGFFGGWDHGRRAGTVITGDPGIVIGKKFWTWGTAPFGRLWEPILTDGGGPYIEPQAGAYSDNQPDYHWMEPGEVKSYSHYFFPVRDIGLFKEANLHGALNLELEDNALRLGVYSTAILKAARILVDRGDQQIFSRTMDLDPAHPFVHRLELAGAGSDPHAFRLSLVDAQGETLLSYQPKPVEPMPLPEPMEDFPKPGEIASQDQLWHAGDWTYKFRDPDGGRAYFEEALRRDPSDSRSNISMAELEIKALRYERALEHLEQAAARDLDNGRLFYLRGVALEALGRYREAHDAYSRAAHAESELGRAYARLAALSLRRGDAGAAVELISRALENNSLNPQWCDIKAAALRQAGRREAAESAARHALELDPLDAWAAHELRVLAPGHGGNTEAGLVSHLLHDSQTALETAVGYIGLGLYRDADELLATAPEDALVQYYRGFLAARLGDRQQARTRFRRAAQASLDHVFAFRAEEAEIFRTALDFELDDGRAHYYLGLVFAKAGDVQRAVGEWQEAVRLEPENARAWRNLGLALARQGGESLPRALECYETASRLAPADSRILLELDEVRERSGISAGRRLAALQQHRETVVERDELVARLVDLLLAEGDYAGALEYLDHHHFNSWEGSYGIHNAYIEAHVGAAEKASNPQEALDHYLKACEYPMNLEVAPREPNLRGFLYYPMARLYAQTGNQEEARRLLEITAGESTEYPTLATFFQALALRDLGRETEAARLLSEFEDEAGRLIAADSQHYRRMGDRDQQALGHYYLARVLEIRGQVSEARQELEAARRLEPRIAREAVMIAQRVFARAHQ